MPTSHLWRWFVAAALLSATAAPGAEESLLKDVNGGTEALSGSNPRTFLHVNGTTYFSATTRGEGAELWTTDGTASGTRLFRDFFPGIDSSGAAAVASSGGDVFIVADDGNSGRELWKSDGTRAGTALVKDVAPGSASANPSVMGLFGGKLYFAADHPAHGTELWRTDGTAEGTVLVCDIAPGNFSSFPSALTQVGTELYFSATSPLTGREVYRLDLASDLCTIAADLEPGAGSSWEYLGQLVSFGGALYVRAKTTTAGSEIWKLSPGGTPQLLADIVPGAGGSDPRYLVASGNRLYFSATTGAGAELWVSDGTTAGTSLLKDIEPGSAGSKPFNITPYGTGVVFAGTTAASGTELWISDGTTAGTVQLVDLVPGSGGSTPWDYVNIGGVLYFAATTPTTGRELWQSDGTAAGTKMVFDFAPGGVSGNPTAAACGAAICVSANSTGSTREFFHYAPGANPVRIGLEADKAWSYPTELTSIGDWAIFSARTPADGVEPWITDGTSDGTRLIANLDLTASAASSHPGYFERVGSLILFFASDGGYTDHLWRSDGTTAGTTQLKQVGRPPNLPRATEVAGSLLFFAGNVSGTVELWMSDGTVTGTKKLKDVLASAFSAYPSDMHAVGGVLYYSAAPGWPPNINRELWRTDGTAAGTARVYAIDPEPGMVSRSGTLYFAARDATTGLGLWKSDGSTAGTELVKSFPDSAEIASLTVTSSGVYFVAGDAGSGVELWRTDGTLEGTELVADLRVGADGSEPRGLTAIDDRLYFSADDGTHGRELWVIDEDGSAPRLIDLVPGAESSMPRDFVATLAGGAIALVASDPDHGQELWRSDGTAEGSRRLTDLVPGMLPSSPRELTVVGANLVFVATGDTGDRELWKMPLVVFDRTPPAIEVVMSGDRHASGIFTGDVAIEFVVTDAESQVSALEGCEPATIDVEGASVRTCVATSRGGTSTRTVTILRDVTPPAVTCPADLAAEATEARGAPVTFAVPPPTDLVDSAPIVESTPAPGAWFPLGSTEVTVTATDAAGHSSGCSFAVEVRDTTAPTLSCPPRIEVLADAPAQFAATASDSVDPAPVIAYSHDPGSSFPPGVTVVTATATDAAHNRAECTFEVDVVTMSEVTACGCSGSGSSVGSFLLAAVWLLARRRRRGTERPGA